MKYAKRTLSTLLALLMLVSVLPMMSVSAAATIVTEVRATVSTPVVGYALSTLNDTYTNTKGVEITDLNWTKSNGAIYPTGTKFEAGVTYYCDMEFTVKDGYTFPNSYTQLKGYINGVVGEISTVYYTDHAYVTAAFTPVSDGEVFVAGIGMNDGDYLPVGGTSTTKSKVSDRYAFYNDGVLTLHDYTFCGTGFVLSGSYSYFCAAIVGESLKEIVVEGNCELVSTSDARYDECIWFFPDGMETRGTIRGNGDSQLSLSCSYTAIDATQGLTIQDATLTIQNAYDGLEAYDDTIVKNSTIDINVDSYAWYVNGNLSVTDSNLNIISDSGPGLYVCGDAILDNSTIDVNSFETALLTGVYDPGDPNSCDLAVMDCDLTLVSKDSYGIFSEESALLYNSTVTIESVEEGFYAKKDLSINGSQAVIQTSEDCAIYCNSGNSFITSSTVTLPFAGNDGIKFYGDTLYITGSQVTVIQAGDCGIENYGHMVVANSELSLTGDYGIYSKGDLSIEGSEIAAIGKRYGILAYEADIAVTDSYVLAISDEKRALVAEDGTLTIDSDLTVQAADQANGIWGAFDMANMENYRLVQIHKHVYENGIDIDCNICGETRVLDGWIAVESNWYFFKNGAMVKSDWVLDGGKWYYMEADGVMVKNAWRKDSKGWVKLGANGAMLVNQWTTDSQGWCYVGADGYALTNCWKRDSYGWIYLNKEGSMTKNNWVLDGGKWYYLNADGYMVTDKWMQDSKGWVKLGSDGAMLVNQWTTDSAGWCFVGADGYAVTNCWKRDSVGWIYLNSIGSMTKSAWVNDDGQWYYLDANGYMVANATITIGGKKYTFNASGVWVG